MTELRRFNITIDSFEGLMWRDYSNDGDYMDAEAALARITELEAEVQRLMRAGLDAAYGEYMNANEADDWARISEQKNARIAKLETRLAAAEERRAELLADIPTIQHNAELPQYDPVYVRTLQQAYAELQAAQQWQPITGGEQVGNGDTVNDGSVVNVGFIDEVTGEDCFASFVMPDDIRLCRKVQP